MDSLPNIPRQAQSEAEALALEVARLFLGWAREQQAKNPGFLDRLREAPADPPKKPSPAAGQQFVERMDEWRRGMGWGHERFASHIGISRAYWHQLRIGARPLSLPVAQRVLRERPEFEHYLASAILERPWGHARRSPDGR